MSISVIIKFAPFFLSCWHCHTVLLVGSVFFLTLLISLTATLFCKLFLRFLFSVFSSPEPKAHR